MAKTAGGTGSNKEAIQIAKNAHKNAYAPYSKFKVGAALVATNGQIFGGCNVENAVYQGFCAERAALMSAVTAGQKEFSEIYIYTEASTPTPPCGNCRQFLNEFFEPNTKVHLIHKDKVAKTFEFSDLLPEAFGPKNLK